MTHAPAPAVGEHAYGTADEHSAPAHVHVSRIEKIQTRVNSWSWKNWLGLLALVLFGLYLVNVWFGDPLNLHLLGGTQGNQSNVTCTVTKDGVETTFPCSPEERQALLAAAAEAGKDNGSPDEDNLFQDAIPASTATDNSPQMDCPSQKLASQIIHGNTTALVMEPSETCLFEFRAPLGIDLKNWCPEAGFVNPRSGVQSPWKWDCEFDPSPNDPHGNQGIVFQGGNVMVKTDAGSFRPILAYPVGDPVRTACDSLKNHRQNLIDHPAADPNFWQWPGNFVCDESQQPQQPEHSNPCPDTKNAVVKALGGHTKASEWRRFNDGQWVRTSDIAADMKVPFGTLDWWDGKHSHMGKKSASNGYAATWNCLATQK